MVKWTHDGVTLLKELMDDNESFECLYLIGQNRLGSETIPDGQRGVIVPSIYDAFCLLAVHESLSAYS